jgi:glycosyltransferase involved in cell wall biosynthesis
VRQDIDFAALVAGDGPELERLRSYVEGAALRARVRLLGAVSNERVQELMAAADVFFLPSQWEGIALSMYEAMACGLPVVGADVGGQRELVTPECGVLVARSDEETEVGHYAEALATLLRNPQRRRAMGQAGYERVRTHFRLDQMGERMTALVYKAMRLHVAQPRPVPDRDWGRARAARMVTYMQAQAVVRRFLSPSARAMLDKNKSWLLPLKETVERVLLR